MDDAKLDEMERRITGVGMATEEDALALLAEVRAYKKQHAQMLAILLDEVRTREYRRALGAQPAPLAMVDARFAGAHVVERR